MTDLRLTHVGGPTVLIEVGGRRLLTDPTFDPPGRRYRFGWGTVSRKLAGPAVAPSDLGRIDAVLLTHDHHDDNLDAAGRALLPSVGAVVTTSAGARRLGGSARGLGVQFPVTGPVRYTMTARDAVKLCGLVRPRTALPVHYEGWKHLREGRDAIEDGGDTYSLVNGLRARAMVGRSRAGVAGNP